ncbi:uncharacterized protein LOC143863275 [Tasmannia lanceolata]|uniref:uncharacterized protein LOC143863275 n=1 Tax=Tasmannia lanceolata TaxID=3420 RepID=UPI00406294AB
MRSRRPGGVRIRDHRSKLRTNPNHGSHGEEPLNRRPRSLSPLERERTRMDLGGDPRSDSVKRTDYNRRLDSDSNGNRDDYMRIDYNRCLDIDCHGNRDNDISHLRLAIDCLGNDISHLPHSPSGKLRNWSQFDDHFPLRDSSSGSREYFFPDPSASLDIKPNHNIEQFGIRGGDSISRVSEDKDFLGNGFSGLDGHGMLVQKSMCLENGTVRSFFTPPPESSYSSGPALNSGKVSGHFLSSSANLNIGLHEDEDLRYRDHVHQNKMPVRESYEEENKSSYHLMRSSQSKAYGSTSCGLGRKDFSGSYRDGLYSLSGGFGVSTEKFSDPLDSDGYGRAKLFGSGNGSKLPSNDPKSYQRDPLSPARDESRDFGYAKLGRRGGVDASFLSDELYKKLQPSGRGDRPYRELSASTFMDRVGDRVDVAETSSRNLREGGFWDHHSLPRDPITKYQDLNRTPQTMDRHEDFHGSRSTNLEFGTKTSHENEIRHFGRDPGLMGYKGRLKSPPLSEHDLDMYGLDASSQRRSNAEEMGVYDPSERALKRKYLADEMNRHDPRSTVPNNQNTFGRIRQLSGIDEQWIGEERVSRIPGRFFYGSHIVSVSDTWLPSEDVPVHVQGGLTEPRLPGVRDFNIKRRL